MGEDDTSIRIKRSTWQRLHRRKEPGMSFDDVLNDILDRVDESPTAAN